MSLDEVDGYGQTPLFYAANENRLEIVRKYATKCTPTITKKELTISINSLLRHPYTMPLGRGI